VALRWIVAPRARMKTFPASELELVAGETTPIVDSHRCHAARNVATFHIVTLEIVES